ncbi:hypothetical protein GOBAR_AA10742 [Gossypium barbadense]|uniref:RING-type E3 ubiquitin transferase n=1 Tax=Gossypium barbadense TaxID=3634 RepID=A0A2P5Y2S4_GOSBA|nr:hypothetical protein GOBAR_AA10742 [Gossypium barbadense]
MASPPPPLFYGVVGGGAVNFDENYNTSDRSHSSSSIDNVKPSVIVIILILSITVLLSVSLYLLLRHLNRRCLSRVFRSSASNITASASHRVTPEQSPAPSFLDSLPMFTFSSITRRSNNGSTVSGDCAVCLSKFEPLDQLRLLPLCCHAQRQTGSDSGDQRRSYSIGSFDYIVEEESQLNRNQIHQRNMSDKEEVGRAEAISEASLAAEVANGRSRLKEYVDRLSFSLSSRAMSFRSSGRLVTGSSGRSDISGADGDYDLEANRFGEEISEMFRWFSGIKRQRELRNGVDIAKHFRAVQHAAR